MLRTLLSALLFSSLAERAAARVNATNALDVFLITDCSVCTKDKNSIFCTAAASDSNYVYNGSVRMTISQKKAKLGPGPGASFCWAGAWRRPAQERAAALASAPAAVPRGDLTSPPHPHLLPPPGTFGTLLQNSGGPMDVLGSSNVSVDLACGDKQLFYRQCVLDTQTTEILIGVGSVLILAICTCTCFSCGCCKCCNKRELTNVCAQTRTAAAAVEEYLTGAIARCQLFHRLTVAAGCSGGAHLTRKRRDPHARRHVSSLRSPFLSQLMTIASTVCSIASVRGCHARNRE